MQPNAEPSRIGDLGLRRFQANLALNGEIDGADGAVEQDQDTVARGLDELAAELAALILEEAKAFPQEGKRAYFVVGDMPT
jgi:hypothetical protein